MRRFAILLVATLAVGPTSAARDESGRDARQLAQALAGRSPGPPERCVSAQQLGAARIVGQTLLYRDGRTLWRNDIADCPALAREPILVIELFGSQLCNDRFRTAERGGIAIPGPSCRFGKFTPYRSPR